MKDLGYYNGKYDLIENMTVPMNDRASWFGDGVYDVSVARNGIPHRFEYHIDRFFRSAEKIRIVMPVTKEELKKITFDMMAKLDTDNVMIYWQVTRGYAPGYRAHAFDPSIPGNLWMTVKPCEIKRPEKTLRLISVEDTRYLLCDIKTINLLPNCLAEQAAKDVGCDTAVFHRGNTITECAHSNVHIIKGGKVITHPLDDKILPGTVRANMLRLCDEIGVPTEEREFTMDELMNADEVFTTSTSALCMRVSEIDGKPVGMKDEKTFKAVQDASYNDFFTFTDKK